MKTKEKVESKKGKKLKIVLLVIAAIVIVAVAFINLTTLPKFDDDKSFVESVVRKQLRKKSVFTKSIKMI